MLTPRLLPFQLLPLILLLSACNGSGHYSGQSSISFSDGGTTTQTVTKKIGDETGSTETIILTTSNNSGTTRSTTIKTYSTSGTLLSEKTDLLITTGTLPEIKLDNVNHFGDDWTTGDDFLNGENH